MSDSPLRVAVYARQSSKQEDGIEQQVADCLAFVQARHWQAAEVYRDNATSATKDRGPGSQWARMLRDFDSGQFDAVVCVRVDRLLRRIVDVVELRKPARPRDVRIVAFGSSLDTGEPMGSAMLTILVALAESEIEIKTARAARYAVERRKVGHPWAGKVPYGYEWVPELHRDKADTRWKVNAAEAKIVKRISREFVKDKKKLGEIARGLNAEGVMTRTGKRWGTSTLRRMMLSPFYAALLPPVQGWADFDATRVVLEECTPGAWKEILTREAVTAARAILMDDTRRLNPEGTARKWLLSGLVTCATCGTPIRSARTREGFHGYRCPAGHFLMRGEVLDDYVSEVAVARLSEPDAAALLRAPVDGPDMATLNGLRLALDQRETYLSRAFAEGRLSPSAADEGLAIVRAEREAVAGQVARMVTSDPLAEVVGAEDVRRVWDGLSLGRRREIVASLFVATLASVGKGVRVLDNDSAARAMKIAWHRPRGNFAFPLIVNEANSPTGRLSDQAREAIAASAS